MRILSRREKEHLDTIENLVKIVKDLKGKLEKQQVKTNHFKSSFQVLNNLRIEGYILV